MSKKKTKGLQLQYSETRAYLKICSEENNFITLVKSPANNSSTKMFSGYDNDMDVDSPYRPPAMIACFNEIYRCQPASALSATNPLRHTLDFCGKIILPQSALEQLSNYNIEYPMIFKITNDRNGSSSHCGVLEFSAKEGVSYIPGWLMETLDLKSGDFVQISNTRLPSGKLIKIQPQSPDFLEITDPRAVLEFTLRQFTTLSPNDCFWINYADHIFKVKVLETEPDPTGILVIETDLNVDFAPPVGYVEPDYKKMTSAAASNSNQHHHKCIANSIGQYGFSPKSSSGPFSGIGQSLRSSSSGIKSPTPTPTTTTIHDPSRPTALKLPKNTMFFGVSQPPKKSEESEGDGKAAAPVFQGKGRSLR